MARALTPREEYQQSLKRSLAGDEAAAELVRERWEPIRQFTKEGPNVGETTLYDHDEEAGRWKPEGSFGIEKGPAGRLN